VNRTRICIGLLLLLVTLAVYWQTGSHDFVNYDDNLYVTDNPQVKAGLSLDGLRWAFTTTHAANWHPLTWLSHMADVELFGLQPRGHHLTSVLLHGLNALLLFLLLVRASGSLWPSAFAAALFALHPLRVESVAWVAERKDVLSALCALLALSAYVRYAERPRVGSYLLSLGLFALGLLAKPMLVTLPFIMLLLDYWPLGRCAIASPPASQRTPLSLVHLLLEKVPFLALSAASCLITFLAQQHGRTVASVDAYPLLLRLENALIAYVRYLASLFYPFDLAVFYPLPAVSHPGTAVAAALLLSALTIAVLRARRRLPFLVSGWFWYLVSLLPVIGLVQVGTQSRADRYTYLPMIGIAIMIAWGGKRLSDGRPGRQRALGVTATATLLLLCGLTWRQAGFWRDSQSLFHHAIAVTDNNYVALTFLGNDHFSRGRYREAARYYALSLSIMPQQSEAHHNLGLTFLRQGNPGRAELHFRDALRLMPDMVEPRYELALLLAGRNETAAAISELEEVVRLQPGHVDARYNLGLAHARQGRFAPAIDHFSEVLRRAPGHAGARLDLERCRHALGAGDGRTSGP